MQHLGGQNLFDDENDNNKISYLRIKRPKLLSPIGYGGSCLALQKISCKAAREKFRKGFLHRVSIGALKKIR